MSVAQTWGDNQVTWVAQICTGWPEWVGRVCVALCGLVRGCLYSAAQAGVGWGGLGADLSAEVYGGARHEEQAAPRLGLR